MFTLLKWYPFSALEERLLVSELDYPSKHANKRGIITEFLESIFQYCIFVSQNHCFLGPVMITTTEMDWRRTAEWQMGCRWGCGGQGDDGIRGQKGCPPKGLWVAMVITEPVSVEVVREKSMV